jgi:hypothetical protein
MDVQVHGAGPTVLMYPLRVPLGTGLPPETRTLKQNLDRALLDALSGRYELVMFDYPPEPKPETFTPANVVRDLLAIADSVCADRFAW